MGDILRLGVSVMPLEGLKKFPIIHTQSNNSASGSPNFPSGPRKPKHLKNYPA